MESERIILGIDPGTQILGYGLIRIIGKRAEFIDMGVLNLRKERDHFKKLQLITENVTALIERFSPDELAVEAPFYGGNPQTMLKLGRAQGAAIASALLKDIPVCEYAPRSVKLAITGRGSASKEQVAMMVKSMLNIDILPEFLDATDALAIAMCHYLTGKNALAGRGNGTSWENFVKNNPDRIKPSK
ncbi:MAG: crossover junction endodeoxyribonuclease RuvC [Candidatus Egerieousia sp.]|nr:crossover junction endodeoxyribonuclease RuvC [Candidatus Egerieousia sp.]